MQLKQEIQILILILQNKYSKLSYEECWEINNLHLFLFKITEKLEYRHFLQIFKYVQEREWQTLASLECDPGNWQRALLDSE